MRIAVIDCGSNTFNLLIADAAQDSWKTIFQNKLPVKLGAGSFETEGIIESRFYRGLDALLSFKAAMDNFGVQKVFSFATSAIRDAKNGREFTAKAEQITGISIEIIDGNREAELIYEGVRQTLDMGAEPSLIMDIGGGSTEFIIGNANEIFWKKSYALGVSRLFDRIQPGGRMTHESTFALRQILERDLADLKEALNTYPCHWIIGSSGSFDTLLDLFRHAAADIDRAEKPGLSNDISLSAFPAIHAWLMGSQYEERLAHPAIPSIRAEFMPLSSYLVKFVLELHPFRRLIHSAYSLKEGAIRQLLGTINWEEEQLEKEKPEDFLEE